MIKKCEYCGKEYEPDICHPWQKYCCKRCNKKARVKNLGEWFKEYKKTFKCSKCGLKDSRVLEFHHLIKTKDYKMICRLNSFSKTRIIEEAKKCIPLCANCHRILHYN